MIDLITAARDFQSLCQQKKWQFCFIGGLAVQHWGEPRLTRDIDVALLTGFGDEAKFIETILAIYQPRRGDAVQFALQHRVLLVESTDGISFDVSLAALPYEQQLIERATRASFLPEVELQICSPEDLIVLKSFAGRPQDWLDVESVIVRQGTSAIDWNYIESNLAPLIELKQEPETIHRLRKLRSEFL